MKYDKSQIGWFLIVVLVLINISISISYFFQIGDKPLTENVYYVLFSLFVLLLLIFYKLRVKVDEKGIDIIYGVGLIKIGLRPDEVISVKKVKNSWIHGYGIRIISGGILYNIQGIDAVEINYVQKSKNKKVRIGSADVDNLLLAIKSRYENFN